MGYKSSDRHRNDEICTMYFSVMKLSLSKGKSEREAKKDALDAINLRFHISEKRARMLISECIHNDTSSYIGSFYVQNDSLISVLKEINEMKQREIDRNNKLIELLLEVNKEYGKKNR